jgi:hypothetical protein
MSKAGFGMLSWDQVASSAFPSSCRSAADEAARMLGPFIDKTYRLKSVEAVACGRDVQIPDRVHFTLVNPNLLGNEDPATIAALCLCSRSTDGHLRQFAAQRILGQQACWTIPFVALLAGEYVVEIIAEIVAAIPNLDRAAYSDFVRENRELMRALRAKATSYWNIYYRTQYPERAEYPGLLFLHQIEAWAA